jgi:hypothetical protein
MKRRSFTVTALAATALMAIAMAALADPASDAAGSATRVEAHSADLLAVGLVQGQRLSIRLSRVLDNAPVHDAAVAVVLRGATYPTVAESDGSYSLSAKDLTLPGEAAIEFHVTQQQQHEDLKGLLKVAVTAKQPESQGNARQMWWWALNFGVCIGFLVLFSRRRKSAQS